VRGRPSRRSSYKDKILKKIRENREKIRSFGVKKLGYVALLQFPFTQKGALSVIVKKRGKYMVKIGVFLFLFLCFLALLLINWDKMIQLIPVLIPLGIIFIYCVYLYYTSRNKKRKEEKYLRSLNNLQALSELDPIEFEKIVGKLYQANGYKVYMTKKSKDEGIDLYLEKSNKRIVIQCKHHPERNIGVRIVRELHGAMIDKGASKAILVTSGYFSQPAKNYAKGKPIQLIDGQELVEMLMNTFGDNYEVFPPPEKSEKSTFDREDLIEVDLRDFVPKGRP